MAKRKPINEDLVREYVDRFTKAQTNRSTFERIFAELKEDDRPRAADVIEISHRYGRGGPKPSSKAAALAAISKRFVEIVRFHAKNKIAEKARPW
jgi:hypothetical protein